MPSRVLVIRHRAEAALADDFTVDDGRSGGLRQLMPTAKAPVFAEPGEPVPSPS